MTIKFRPQNKVLWWKILWQRNAVTNLLTILFFEIQSYSEEKFIFGKAQVIDGDTIKIITSKKNSPSNEESTSKNAKGIVAEETTPNAETPNYTTQKGTIVNDQKNIYIWYMLLPIDQNMKTQTFSTQTM